MDEEEIKRKMLQKRLSEQDGQDEIKQQVKAAASQILEKEARERLNNLRVVKPDLAFQVEAYLAQLAQSGQVRQKITDEQLKELLKQLSDHQKKDFNIRRK